MVIILHYRTGQNGQREYGLLRHDTVTQGLELLITGEADGRVGDVARRQAHQPFNEGGA